jgi:GGDEF domain-containing protein
MRAFSCAALLPAARSPHPCSADPRRWWAVQERAAGSGENLDRGRRADGTEFPIDVALGPAEFGGERLVVAIVRDITDRKLRQDELRHLSEHGALTGLLNRRGLDRELAKAVAHARRHADETTLLLLDLDGVKLVNDRHGHLEGDRLLRHLVQALARRLRSGDTMGRLGGDEFALRRTPRCTRPSALVAPRPSRARSHRIDGADPPRAGCPRRALLARRIRRAGAVAERHAV